MQIVQWLKGAFFGMDINGKVARLKRKSENIWVKFE